MTTSTDIVNEALQYLGDQTQITSLADGSVAANAATVIYAPVWQMVARQLDPDFARRTTGLAPVAGGQLPPGIAYEYGYPVDCLRLRALAPATGYDIYDPQLILGNVALDVIGGTPTKVIFTNTGPTLFAVYTSNDLTESQWDASFREAVVRQLASPLAMALAGRPDYAREILQQAAQYEQMAELVDESSTGGP